jgi:serine/threonine protein kinase
MATVYLAVQDMLHRYVALKVMLPELIRDENFRKSFLSEGSTIASLQHSNIVSIHDIGITDDSVFYMAMEYLSGGSLRDILTKGKLSYSHIIFILEELASGLSYAHKKGYIHRDIKPGNILFRDNGVAVLSDFGIAKLKGSSGDMTRMGFTQGTLQYMSPEQVTTSSLDHRSDIYSLGLVFYEMLTGDRSFFTNTSLQNILQRPIPQLPDEYAFLQTVLDKVLSIKPEERYQDADEFVRAIKTADHLANTASFVVQEKQESNDDDTTQYYPADRIYPQPKQKKTGLLLASLFVLFGVSAFGAYQYFLSAETSSTSSTSKNFIDNDKQQTLAEQKVINKKEAEQARLKQMTIQKAEAEKKLRNRPKRTN